MCRLTAWACGAAVALCVIAAVTPAQPAMAQAPNLSELDIVLKSVPNGPIARINGQSVPSQEFVDLYHSELARIRSLERRELDPAERVQIGLRVLGMLVERGVLHQEAQKRGFEVSDAELQEAWQEELDTLQEEFQERGLDAPDEQELLEQAGTTREKALAELRKALLIERMREAIFKEHNVQVDEQRVREEYEKNSNMFTQPERIHLQQIFIKAPANGNDREAARERAEGALQRIRAGQKFETVARDLSDGSLAEQGGDPGPLPASELPPFMVAAAREMEPGNVSGIIESDFGFHIIKLNEIQTGNRLSYNDVKPLIERQLLSRKGAQVIRDFVQQAIGDESGSYEVETYLQLEKQLRAYPEILESLQSGSINAEQ